MLGEVAFFCDGMHADGGWSQGVPEMLMEDWLVGECGMPSLPRTGGDMFWAEPVTYDPAAKQVVFKGLRHGLSRLQLAWKSKLTTPFVLDGSLDASEGTTISSSVFDKEVRMRACWVRDMHGCTVDVCPGGACSLPRPEPVAANLEV